MSDILGAEAPLEEEAPLEFVGPQTNPRMQAIGALYGEADPDKAVRAHELSKTTGLPPTAIYDNVEDVDRQVKNTLSAHLVNNNTYLRDYVNSHPLAAKVSHDDWGKLNSVTDRFLEALKPTPLDLKVYNEFVKGFRSQFDPEQEGKHLKEVRDYYAGRTDLAAAVGYTGNQILAGTFDTALLGMHLLGGAVIGGLRGIGQYVAHFTGDEKWTEEGGKLGEALMDPGVAASLGPLGAPLHVLFGAKPHNVSMAQTLHEAQLEHAMEIAAPYIQEGRPIPTGLHPLIDQIKIEQAEADAKAIPKLHREVQSTNTFERSPDFARLALERLPDHEFGLKPDAVREMYGEKEPQAGDGKLGDVITGDQLREAEAAGTDLSVGAKDWFTKVDPAVAKELEEHIRYRKGGLTSDEAVTVKAMVEAYHGSPHEFEAFDLGKAGTGEGAQAYGFGHYVAENKQVAASYSESAIDRSIQPRIAELEAKLDEGKGTPAEIAEYHQLQQRMQAAQGNLYRVRIKRNAEEFIDYDKPIAEQPPEVQKALTQRWALMRGITEADAAKVVGDMPTAGDIIKTLERYSSPKQVAKELADAGIPGIKFLDQGSRLSQQDIATMKSAYERTKQRFEAKEPGVLESDVEAAKQRFEQTQTRHGEQNTRNFVVFSDSDLEIISRNGEALRQAREQAGLPTPEEAAANLQRESIGAGVSLLTKPTETYTAHEQRVVEQVQKVLSRIVPEIEGKIVPRIEMWDRPVSGVYVAPKDAMPIIAVALDAKDAGKTARHEAIHFLRDYGFFEEGEWKALEDAAREGQWIGKHDIRERYKKHAKDEAALLEEAIAEEFGEWGSTTEAPRKHLNDAVQKSFEKLAAFFKEILDAMKEMFGHTPTVDELFEKIESGEVGSRAQEGQPQGGAVKADEPKKPFEKGGALGLTEVQYNRKLKLIEKQRQEDTEYLTKKYEDEIRRQQTPEWKANREKMHLEIAEEMPLRPAVAADRLFAEGLFPDGRKTEKPKVDIKLLSKQQKEALPKEYYGAGGENPDHIATYLGFHTGDDMIQALAKYTTEREASGMTPQAYMRRLTDIETDKRMAAEHGELQANILADAMEHVASETTFDILHEDTLAAAIRADAEFSITKGQFKAGIIDGMDSSRMGGVDSTKFFEAAGRAGREAVAASDKKDFVESFRQQQRQYAAMVKAKEALKLEKEQKAFDKLAKRYAKSMKIDREVKVAPEYLNFVYRLLADVGKPIGRSEAHLAEAMNAEGFKNIGELIADKQGGYPTNNGVPIFDLPIADFLLDGTFKKGFDELTVEEFRGVSQAIKVLEKQGRGEKLLIREGDAVDREAALHQMREQVRGFAENVQKLKDGSVVKKGIRRFLAGITNFETLFNRFDRNNSRGLFNQYLVRPLTQAANFEATLKREVSKPYGELGKIDNPKKLMASPLLDPNSGKPISGFTRENALVILQNMGNESNWDTFARGWKADPEKLRDWVFANLTKEDFDRAQQMGDTIFKPLFEKAKTAYYNMYGVMPEEIQLTGVKTPWKDANGNEIIYKGWYHPLIRDDFYETKGSIAKADPTKAEKVFKRAQTMNGYAKDRTGAAYPVDLTFDKIPQRITEMIHDIAFRPALLETGKIINDKGLRQAIATHYGEEYRDMLNPYFRDIAGVSTINSKAMADATKFSEYLRQNVIGTYIGFNPYTVLKHGPSAWVNSMAQVGGLPFVRAFRDSVTDLYGKSPEVGVSWKEFVDKHSEEVRRRERHWQETIGGQHSDIYGKGTFRETVLDWGSKAVAFSDMISARPTWLAAYRNAIKAGFDHGQAVFEGDRAVRFAHGSTAVTNQPGIVRGGGPLNSWVVSLYGFFGTMMQRRIQLAYELNDMYKLGRQGELKEAASMMPGFAARTFAFIIFPTLVEEEVTSIGTDDKRGFGQRLAVGAITGFTSSIPYIRDLAWPLLHGHKPEIGLSGSPLGDIEKLIHDIKLGKKMFSKEHAGKSVEDLITSLGVTTGLAPKQLGHVARFGIDTASGKARPKVLNDALLGLGRGTEKRRVVK